MYQIRQYESEDRRKEVDISSVKGKIDECKEKWLIHLSRIGNDGLPYFVTNQSTIKMETITGRRRLETCRWVEPNPWKAADEEK
jgi:hypothetical protein